MESIRFCQEPGMVSRISDPAAPATQALAEDMARKLIEVDDFLAHVLHGDEEHRAWLKKEFEDYFEPLKSLARAFLTQR